MYPRATKRGKLTCVFLLSLFITFVGYSCPVFRPVVYLLVSILGSVETGSVDGYLDAYVRDHVGHAIEVCPTLHIGSYTCR